MKRRKNYDQTMKVQRERTETYQSWRFFQRISGNPKNPKYPKIPEILKILKMWTFRTNQFATFSRLLVLLRVALAQTPPECDTDTIEDEYEAYAFSIFRFL
jgi:hypothetical protein